MTPGIDPLGGTIAVAQGDHQCRVANQITQHQHLPSVNANGSTSWSPKVPLMCSVWFILTKGIYLLRKEEGESCHWNIIQLSFKGAGCASTPGHLLDPSTGTVPPDSCHNVASSWVSCSSSRATRVKDAVPDRSRHSEKSREPLTAPAASTLLSKDHISVNSKIQSKLRFSIFQNLEM